MARPARLLRSLYFLPVNGSVTIPSRFGAVPLLVAGAGLGACLADDMGLGKTITVIALHLHRAEHATGPTLVVCPASLLGNWEAEIRRFAPGVDVRRHHGSARDLDGASICMSSGTTNELNLADWARSNRLRNRSASRSAAGP